MKQRTAHEQIIEFPESQYRNGKLYQIRSIKYDVPLVWQGRTDFKRSELSAVVRVIWDGNPETRTMLLPEHCEGFLSNMGYQFKPVQS